MTCSLMLLISGFRDTFNDGYQQLPSWTHATTQLDSYWTQSMCQIPDTLRNMQLMWPLSTESVTIAKATVGSAVTPIVTGSAVKALIPSIMSHTGVIVYGGLQGGTHHIWLVPLAQKLALVLPSYPVVFAAATIGAVSAISWLWQSNSSCALSDIGASSGLSEK